MSLALPRSDAARQNGAGIASMLLAVLLYGCMDALIKFESARYPVVEVMFFRSLFALLPLGLAPDSGADEGEPSFAAFAAEALAFGGGVPFFDS